jgi:hypothetical protein
MAQRLAQPQQALLGEAAGGCSRRTEGLCEQLTVARHLDACKVRDSICHNQAQ